MKRDWDLIRDILIEIENAEDMDAFFEFFREWLFISRKP